MAKGFKLGWHSITKIEPTDSNISVIDISHHNLDISEVDWKTYHKRHIENLKRICKDMTETSAYCRRELEMWEASERSDTLAETAFSTDVGD